CDKVSSGCTNCFAESIAKRFWKGRPFTDVQCHYDRLEQPLHWKKPATIFVCSMGDLFHKDVPDKFQYEVFQMMCIGAPQHTYIILTKRPDIMADRYADFKRNLLTLWGTYWHHRKEYKTTLDNIILGVSVEDQKTWNERVPLLLNIPAKTRIVSIEPMLQWINVDKYLPKLSGIICGCESGTNRRKFEEYWARDVKDTCVDYGIPFFMKQSIQNGKLVKMPKLDGRVYNQMPEGK
ncbi:hypothetical protein LCGC14_2162020, partial [marine sediment metagenome]